MINISEEFEKLLIAGENTKYSRERKHNLDKPDFLEVKVKENLEKGEQEINVCINPAKVEYINESEVNNTVLCLNITSESLKVVYEDGKEDTFDITDKYVSIEDDEYEDRVIFIFTKDLPEFITDYNFFNRYNMENVFPMMYIDIKPINGNEYRGEVKGYLNPSMVEPVVLYRTELTNANIALTEVSLFIQSICNKDIGFLEDGYIISDFNIQNKRNTVGTKVLKICGFDKTGVIVRSLYGGDEFIIQYSSVLCTPLRFFDKNVLIVREKERNNFVLMDQDKQSKTCDFILETLPEYYKNFISAEAIVTLTNKVNNMILANPNEENYDTRLNGIITQLSNAIEKLKICTSTIEKMLDQLPSLDIAIYDKNNDSVDIVNENTYDTMISIENNFNDLYDLLITRKNTIQE